MTEIATSSIGAVWPPQQASNERLRGFYTDGVVAADPDSLESFENILEAERQAMLDTAGCSRLTIRAIMETGAIGLLQGMVQVEAAIPLSNGYEGLHVVYVGYNQPDRQGPKDELDHQRQSLLQIIAKNSVDKPPKPITTFEHVKTVTRPMPDGFALGVHMIEVDSSDIDALTPGFTDLYEPFNFDTATVNKILTNPNNRIVYLFDTKSGQIACSATIEMSTFEITGLGKTGSDKVGLVEVTNAITSPEYQKMGLYRQVLRHVRADLRQQFEAGKPIHAMFGECNLAAPGVLKATLFNGDRFSVMDTDDLGLSSPSFGVLPQHVAVSHGAEPPKLSNFAISYNPALIKLITGGPQ